MTEKAHCSAVSKHDIEELVAGRFEQAQTRRGQIEGHISGCTVCKARLEDAKKHQNAGSRRGIFRLLPLKGKK